MNSMFAAADTESLPPGQVRTVEVRGHRVALANVDGEFFAVADRCPHRGGPLGAGFLQGRTLHCPLHGWGFDVATGACDTRPELPVNCHRVEVRDGQVWIELGGD
ncbi:MAG: Rieske 2Fe-2S domain-containing protein [Verrucomicrobiae bacterium]|nr:Rieske 2Fe-2S domain-containing protein [Verrucomicrobiae bacterium]